MRIRSFAPLLVLAIAALASSPGEARASAPPAPPSAVAQHEPIVGDSLVLLTAHELPTIQMADAHPGAPLSHAPLPLSTFSLLGFAIGATAKKSTRRSSGKASKLKLLLDSTVHLRRDPKRPDITVIDGGVLVDDTDLDDDEIEELKRHGVIRPASAEEIARLEAAEETAGNAELLREQEYELTELRANQAAELEGKSDAEKAKLAERHSKAVAALQEKHVKALNA
jgi:hypothetical protein